MVCVPAPEWSPPHPGSRRPPGQRRSCRYRRCPTWGSGPSQSDSLVWDAGWRTDWRCSSVSLCVRAGGGGGKENHRKKHTTAACPLVVCGSAHVGTTLPQSTCLLRASAAEHTAGRTLSRHPCPAGWSRRQWAPPWKRTLPSGRETEEGDKNRIKSDWGRFHLYWCVNVIATH